MSKRKKIYVRPHKRNNKKKGGCHNVRGHYRKVKHRGKEYEFPDAEREYMDYLYEEVFDDDDEFVRTLYMTEHPRQYSQEDLIEMAESRLGWAMAEQLEGVMNGETFVAQNPNALKRIKSFLQDKGEFQMAGNIEDYLLFEDREKRRKGGSFRKMMRSTIDGDNW